MFENPLFESEGSIEKLEMGISTKTYAKVDNRYKEPRPLSNKLNMSVSQDRISVFENPLYGTTDNDKF